MFSSDFAFTRPAEREEGAPGPEPFCHDTHCKPVFNLYRKPCGGNGLWNRMRFMPRPSVIGTPGISLLSLLLCGCAPAVTSTPAQTFGPTSAASAKVPVIYADYGHPAELSEVQFHRISDAAQRKRPDGRAVWFILVHANDRTGFPFYPVLLRGSGTPMTALVKAAIGVVLGVYCAVPHRTRGRHSAKVEQQGRPQGHEPPSHAVAPLVT